MGNGNLIIGFIGTGVMGRSMARHLMEAGHAVIVHTRTKEKAADLLTSGAVWAETPGELAKKANVIFTIVGYPQDVEAIYFGEDGLIANGQSGALFVDMTTSTPTLAKKIHVEAMKKGIKTLDAPVSGGDIGAREAKLSIMVGGEESDFAEMEPLLRLLGNNVVYQGEPGAGQHTKMVNQIVIASTMMGVAEAMVYAKRAGLSTEKVLSSISTGAAGSWSLSNLAPRMLEGNFEPGFYIKHFIKDMNIALEEAEKMEMKAPGLALARSIYGELEAEGEENSGTQAIYKYWKQQ